jgi:arsenate reductase
VTLTVYHLKTCDTCKKAIRALEAAGHALKLVDVRADGVPADELARIAEAVGVDALLNTRSTTWRGLNDDAKTNVTPEKALTLMGDHPTLIKRPVIDDGTRTTAGWTKDAQAVWLD